MNNPELRGRREPDDLPLVMASFLRDLWRLLSMPPSSLYSTGVDFDSVNVLDYPLIREGVKKYA